MQDLRISATSVAVCLYLDGCCRLINKICVKGTGVNFSILILGAVENSCILNVRCSGYWWRSSLLFVCIIPSDCIYSQEVTEVTVGFIRLHVGISCNAVTAVIDRLSSNRSVQVEHKW